MLRGGRLVRGGRGGSRSRDKSVVCGVWIGVFGGNTRRCRGRSSGDSANGIVGPFWEL